MTVDPVFGDGVPYDHLRWFLVSTTGAYSPPHIDAMGFNTVITAVDSVKLWAVGRPRFPTNTRNAKLFADFCPIHFDVGDFDWEIRRLDSSTMLSVLFIFLCA